MKIMEPIQWLQPQWFRILRMLLSMLHNTFCMKQLYSKQISILKPTYYILTLNKILFFLSLQEKVKVYCDKCWIKEFFLNILGKYILTNQILIFCVIAWLHHGPLYLIIVYQVWNVSVWSYLVALRTLYHQDLTNHSKFFGTYEDHSNYGKWKCFFVIAWLHYVSVTYESKTLVKLVLYHLPLSKFQLQVSV